MTRNRTGTDGVIEFGNRLNDLLKVGSETVAASEVPSVVLMVPTCTDVRGSASIIR